MECHPRSPFWKSAGFHRQNIFRVWDEWLKTRDYLVTSGSCCYKERDVVDILIQKCVNSMLKCRRKWQRPVAGVLSAVLQTVKWQMSKNPSCSFQLKSTVFLLQLAIFRGHPLLKLFNFTKIVPQRVQRPGNVSLWLTLCVWLYLFIWQNSIPILSSHALCSNVSNKVIIRYCNFSGKYKTS